MEEVHYMTQRGLASIIHIFKLFYFIFEIELYDYYHIAKLGCVKTIYIYVLICRSVCMYI